MTTEVQTHSTCLASMCEKKEIISTLKKGVAPLKIKHTPYAEWSLSVRYYYIVRYLLLTLCNLSRSLPFNVNDNTERCS